jgi:hypothetical protein
MPPKQGDFSLLVKTRFDLMREHGRRKKVAAFSCDLFLLFFLSYSKEKSSAVSGAIHRRPDFFCKESLIALP